MKKVLYIEEGDDILLPKKYHRINNICAIIYDQLTEIYNEYSYDELTKTTLKFTEDSILVEELKSKKIDALDWLKQNNLNDEIVSVLTKQLIRYIVSDFLNFMFESMNCAKKGKMTVAYALLRKPITDELLILEQLLVDKDEFINRFFHIGIPDKYDPCSKNIDKQKVIKEAIEKLRINLFTSSEFIYDLRYNKSYKAGINGLTNQALHIVTNDKNYRTLEQNLNFVFSNKDDLKGYYEHYYNLVPYLLIYSVSVIDELIFSVLTDENSKNLKTIKELKRFIGLFLFTEQISGTKREKNNDIFDVISKELKLTCIECGKENNIERADCKLFFETEMFLCTNCFSNLLVDNDSIKKIENFFTGKEN